MSLLISSLSLLPHAIVDFIVYGWRDKAFRSKGNTWWYRLIKIGNVGFAVCRPIASLAGALQRTQAPLSDWGQVEEQERPSCSARVVQLRHELKGVWHPHVNYYTFTDIHGFPRQLTTLPKSKTFLHPIPLHNIATALQTIQCHVGLSQSQNRRDNIGTFHLLQT